MAARPTTEAVWSQLSSDLRRFIRRRVQSDHVADDLLQETFLRIHCGINALRGADRLAAWVYQIARNVIHDHYRKTSSGNVSLAEADPVDDRDGGSSHLAERAGEWLDELVQQLPEPYRDAVELSQIQGLTQREVAERLGLSISGAKSRVQRGRVMLKQILEQCCRFQFDQRGNLMDCDPKPDRTVRCNCDDMELPPLG